MSGTGSILPVKARVLLQQCQHGKAEIYGRQLADLTIYNDKCPAETYRGLWSEISEYCELADVYTISSALDRWRKRPDEVDAEIAREGYKKLPFELSIHEIRRLMYDCAGRKARKLLERAQKADKLDELTDILYQLFLHTVDIPCETQRPFPYDQVFTDVPFEGDEDYFRAHVQGAYIRAAEMFRERIKERSQNPSWTLEHHDARSIFVHAMKYWRFTLEDLRISQEEFGRWCALLSEGQRFIYEMELELELTNIS